MLKNVLSKFATPNKGAQHMSTKSKKSRGKANSKALKQLASKHNSTPKVDPVVKSKANAESTAQPGVIATIMEVLTKAKAKKTSVTSGEILDHLCKTFPQRKREGMIITVRAQLSRLPNEKDFAITKVRDGRVVKYAAA